MTFDINTIRKFYSGYDNKIAKAHEGLHRPLTYAEKVIYSHLFTNTEVKPYKRGIEYAEFRPDRVAMQDATAQMAILQFMNAGRSEVAVPSSIHTDHLICADNGARKDLTAAMEANREVYDFLKSAAAKYHIAYWKPGAGIIHQVVLENYAFPGGMMVGTDSHTPNAGGLGMVAIGVGGADAVDVLTGQPWELKVPKLIGVRLSGRLNGWASPKDVALRLLGLLTVKGGTNSIIEYFGDGVASLSATGRATICNMGAELGATCSLFPYDNNSYEYLKVTGRQDVATLAMGCEANLRADKEVLCNPEEYYDRVIDINLSDIEPHLNGPFTPDAATPISHMHSLIEQNGYPAKVDVALIGSCTNSSYQDLCRAASVIKQAIDNNIEVKTQLIINPGSTLISNTAARDGILDIFRRAGALIMCNACGPCIGQWHRHTDDNSRRNTIVTSFNRNFRRRADGNPNTYAFIAGPELTAALALSGRLDFNPSTDELINREGHKVLLDKPKGFELPPRGFASTFDTMILMPTAQPEQQVEINENSERIQRLEPFKPFNSNDFKQMPVLIKVKGKCTTDHISQAGPWLRFRGHLENISRNLLMGAVNAFNGSTNSVKNQLNGTYAEVSTVAKEYKNNGISSVIIAEDNYGEGSSREHAAMEPRFLNVKVVLAKSFARIHETNLKKQGILALTFSNPQDYDAIQEDDRINVNLSDFAPGSVVIITLTHADGTMRNLEAKHTYNDLQIKWFRTGSALNYLGMRS